MNKRQQNAIDALNALEADDFARVLNEAGARCYEAAAELESAWQDREPGRVWTRIGNALTTCSLKVEQ